MTDNELVRKVSNAMYEKWMSTTTPSELMWPELSREAIAAVRAYDQERNA